MTLYDKLKTLYASGNCYTILQLLQEFIKELKGIDVVTEVSKKYWHRVHITKSDRLNIYVDIFSESSDEMTLRDVLSFIKNGDNYYGLKASGYYETTNEDYYPVYAITCDSHYQLVVLYNLTTDTDISTIIVNDVMVTDKVETF